MPHVHTASQTEGESASRLARQGCVVTESKKRMLPAAPEGRKRLGVKGAEISVAQCTSLMMAMTSSCTNACSSPPGSGSIIFLRAVPAAAQPLYSCVQPTCGADAGAGGGGPGPQLSQNLNPPRTVHKKSTT
jgi:hypothetical protein